MCRCGNSPGALRAVAAVVNSWSWSMPILFRSTGSLFSSPEPQSRGGGYNLCDEPQYAAVGKKSLRPRRPIFPVCSRILVAVFPATTFAVSKVRITLNSPLVNGWNENRRGGCCLVHSWWCYWFRPNCLRYGVSPLPSLLLILLLMVTLQ